MAQTKTRSYLENGHKELHPRFHQKRAILHVGEFIWPSPCGLRECVDKPATLAVMYWLTVGGGPPNTALHFYILSMNMTRVLLFAAGVRPACRNGKKFCCRLKKKKKVPLTPPYAFLIFLYMLIILINTMNFVLLKMWFSAEVHSFY